MLDDGKAISWHLSGSSGSMSSCFPSSSSPLDFEIQAWPKTLGTYSASFVNGLLVFCWLGGSLNKIKPRPSKFLPTWADLKNLAFCFITEVGVFFDEVAAVTNEQCPGAK